MIYLRPVLPRPTPELEHSSIKKAIQKGALPVLPGAIVKMAVGAPTVAPNPAAAGGSQPSLGGPAFPLAQLRVSYLSLHVAADIGYGALFGGKVDADIDFFLIEFLATAERLVSSSGDGPMVHGVGLRMGMACDRANGKVQGNLGVVAATAETHRTHQKLHAKIYGLPGELDAAFFNEFGSMQTTFNMSRLQSFGKATANLAEGIVKEAKKADPAFRPWILYSSDLLGSAYTPWSDAVSNSFALHRIEKGETYSEAIAYLWKKRDEHSGHYPYDQVSPILVRSVYARIVGSDETHSVTDENKKLARSLLQLGAG